MCSLEKVEVLYDMNERKLVLMKNEMSRNVFREVTSFNASREEICGVDIIDGSTMWLAQQHAWVATVVCFLTGKRAEEDNIKSCNLTIWKELYVDSWAANMEHLRVCGLPSSRTVLLYARPRYLQRTFCSIYKRKTFGSDSLLVYERR